MKGSESLDIFFPSEIELTQSSSFHSEISYISSVVHGARLGNRTLPLVPVFSKPFIASMDNFYLCSVTKEFDLLTFPPQKSHKRRLFSSSFSPLSTALSTQVFRCHWPLQWMDVGPRHASDPVLVLTSAFQAFDLKRKKKKKRKTDKVFVLLCSL